MQWMQYTVDAVRCGIVVYGGGCRAIKQGMVFRYTWVYSKGNTMAHTRRLMVNI